MNEVNASQMVGKVLTQSASSKGAAEAQSRNDGKKLPENPEQIVKTQDVKETETPEKAGLVEEGKAKAETSKNVESAVTQINDYVQSIRRDLHFSVDDDLDETVVKVVDSKSGELIRQIPEEVFLELARSLKEDGELRLVNAHG